MPSRCHQRSAAHSATTRTWRHHDAIGKTSEVIDAHSATILQVYEYFVDVKKRSWAHWEEKLSGTPFKIAADTPFYKVAPPGCDVHGMAASQAHRIRP